MKRNDNSYKIVYKDLIQATEYKNNMDLTINNRYFINTFFSSLLSHLTNINNLSLTNLADEVGLSYRTILDLKNGKISPSNQILSKLSQRFNLNELELRYNYLSSLRYLNARNGRTEATTYYLAQLQTKNYVIHDTYNLQGDSTLMPKTFYYAGVAINYKATAPDPKVIIVEDWDILIKDYICSMMFPEIELHFQKNDDYSMLFYNLSTFIESVLSYAINRVKMVFKHYEKRYRTQNVQYSLVFGDETMCSFVKNIQISTDLKVLFIHAKAPNSFDYISCEKYSILRYSFYLLEPKQIITKNIFPHYISLLNDSLEICKKNINHLDRSVIEQDLFEIDRGLKPLNLFECYMIGITPLSLEIELLKKEIDEDNFTTLYLVLLSLIPYLNKEDSEKIYNIMQPLLDNLFTSKKYESYLNNVLERNLMFQKHFKNKFLNRIKDK